MGSGIGGDILGSRLGIKNGAEERKRKEVSEI
jgi:hypothetical protein